MKWVKLNALARGGDSLLHHQMEKVILLSREKRPAREKRESERKRKKKVRERESKRKEKVREREKRFTK